MTRLLLAGLTPSLMALAAGVALAQGPARVEAGVLNCSVAGGTGFVFGSTKSLNCVLQKAGRDERYSGTISKYGIDVGSTTQSTLSWAVLAPTTQIKAGALAGTYGGVSGEATVGVGVGANALVGGSANSIVLQPVSVQVQQGLNVAAGVASLTLRSSR